MTQQLIKLESEFLIDIPPNIRRETVRAASTSIAIWYETTNNVYDSSQQHSLIANYYYCNDECQLDKTIRSQQVASFNHQFANVALKTLQLGGNITVSFYYSLLQLVNQYQEEAFSVCTLEGSTVILFTHHFLLFLPLSGGGISFSYF